MASGETNAGSGAARRAKATAAARFWRDFGLDTLKQELDKREIEVSEHVEKTVLSRKRLAQDTKAFRKLTDDADKVKKIGPLLRGYQEDIDRLTKRARFAETSFLELYKSLFEAPDPTELLEIMALEDIDALREENERLKGEIEDYEDEFTNLKNQDLTIRTLENEIATLKDNFQKEMKNIREQFQEELQDKLMAKEDELIGEFEERMKDLIAKEQAAQESFQMAQARFEEAQDNYDRSQEVVFGLRAAMEESEAVRQAEIDLLSEDLVRANSRVSDLQLKLRDLEARPNSSVSSNLTSTSLSSGQDRERVLELEDELVRKSETEENLRTEISRLQCAAEAASKAHEKALNDNEAALRQLKDDVFKATAELHQRPTQDAFNNLKKQIALLQAVDIGNIEDDDETPTSPSKENGSNATRATLSNAGDFDSQALILKRIRKLEATAAGLRVQLDTEKSGRESAEARCKQAEETAEDLRTELDELREVNSKLLRRSSSDSLFRHSNQMGEESTTLAALSTSSSAASARDRRTSTHSDHQYENVSTADLLLAATEDVGLGSNTDLPGDASADSLLSIVQEQRNDFRKRMLELESERDKLIVQVRGAEQDISTLQNDNVNLREKIRFLQSYSTPDMASQHKRIHPNQRADIRMNIPNSLARTGYNDGLDLEMTEARYRQAYEDKMNPFSDFSARERRRRLHGLNMFDRTTYQAMTYFMSNKNARLGLFIYAFALHALVFFVLSMGTSRAACLDIAAQPELAFIDEPLNPLADDRSI